MRRRATARPSPQALAARLTLALLAAAASACAPPVAVRHYAPSATLVTAKVPAAVASLSASCQRTQSYRLRRTSGSWYGEDSVRAACGGRESALRDVARANRVLAAYFSALGTLAGGKRGELNASVDALADAAGGSVGLDDAKANAVAALASFVASRGAEGYRRTKLRDAIAEQNANVVTVTTLLHEILDRDFTRYLRDDATAQTAFYRSALTESAAREPLAAILIRDSYDDRQAELSRRTDAVNALSRALVVVGRGHQRLYDARDHLGTRELLAEIVASARELDIAIAKMDKAF